MEVEVYATLLDSTTAANMVGAWARNGEVRRRKVDDHIKPVERCIYNELDFRGIPLGERCSSKPLSNVQHGWLCKAHQLNVPRKHIVPQFIEIDALTLLTFDNMGNVVPPTGGIRFDHNFLCTKGIYKADGSEKFPN